jgi:hypothetical protein
MKKRINKIFAAFMLATSLNFALPQKEAKAGFLILAATDHFVLEHKYETLDNLIPYIGFATMIPFGFWFTYTGYSMQSLYSGLFVLDENIDQLQDMTKLALLGRYPFLDDESSVDKLSELISSKYNQQKDKEGRADIILSQDEVLQAVDSLDLSQKQIQELFNTLTR